MNLVLYICPTPVHQARHNVHYWMLTSPFLSAREEPQSLLINFKHNHQIQGIHVRGHHAMMPPSNNQLLYISKMLFFGANNVTAHVLHFMATLDRFLDM